MKCRTACRSLAAILWLAFWPTASAQDYYVDAVNGDDANTGTQAQEAWKTITRAVAELAGTTPAGLRTVHIAPGLYDQALGEVFPLHPTRETLFVGEAGSSMTFLDGGGAAITLVDGGEGDVKLQGMTLRNAENGIYSFIPDHLEYRFVLEDVVITNMTGRGFYGNAAFSGGVVATFVRVRIQNCGEAFWASIYGDLGQFNFGDARLTASDCVFSDSAGTAIFMRQHFESNAYLTLTRCRITGNGGAGIIYTYSASGGSQAQGLAHITHSLIANNGGSGLVNTASTIGGGAIVGHTTIANNGNIGVRNGHAAVILNSILYGNADDLLDVGTQIAVGHTDVGDGDFAGTDGNISADPNFVNPAAGDYRLAFGSPCVDSTVPTEPGKTDLNGLPRAIDGDLDTVEIADMGAFEHAPLFAQGPPVVGGTLTLEFWGPPGGLSALYWTRGPLAEEPRDSPYGEFDLDPFSYRLLALAGTAPDPPVTLQVAIPADPSLAGQVVSFQALSTSGLAMPSRAFTNPLELIIQP